MYFEFNNVFIIDIYIFIKLKLNFTRIIDIRYLYDISYV